MLDGTIPPELHEKYLGIVLNETERLTKLTNSLLTLNNLNMKGMILEKSVFDLNSVIRSTAASFEGTCQQKHIGIELLFNRRPYARSRRQKQNRAGLIQPARQRD